MSHGKVRSSLPDGETQLNTSHTSTELYHIIQKRQFNGPSTRRRSQSQLSMLAFCTAPLSPYNMADIFQ